MKKYFKSCSAAAVSVLMAASVIFSAPIAANALDSAVKTSQTAASTVQTVIDVTKEDIDAYGAVGAIQAALYEARDNASENNVYKICVAKGSYVIDRSLRIFSNTYLSLTDVTLIRDSNSHTNVIRTGEVDAANTGAVGYDAYTNITIDGGTINGGGTYNTILKFAHARNLTLKNTKLSNVKDGHIMEVAGIDGFTVKDCSFSDQILTPGTSIGYEAIQLDTLVQWHFVTYRSEDIPMKNVLIEGCSFTNCPRGVGSHTAILNRPFDGIKIKNCSFTDMTSVAIQGLNWINCEITDNKISNSPRGIAVYSVMGKGSGTYKSSFLAQEGNTTAHVSDSKETIDNHNILIANNEIKKCGYIKDEFASYESGGIFAVGYDLSQPYAQDSSDNSGGLPAGDYYISGVTVRDNSIDVKGHGVRFTDTRSSSIESNTIECSENTLNKANYHGIQLLGAKADVISGNSIKNSSVNGIYIYKNSFASEINNNTVLNSNNYGISVDNAVAEKIYKNTVDTTASNGIHTSNGGSIGEINGNTVKNAGNHGIAVTGGSAGCKAGNIINNTVDKAVTNGIHISSGSTAGDITDNIVTNSGNHGISVTGQSSAGSISSNTIYGSKYKSVNLGSDSKATVGTNYDALSVQSITLSHSSMTLGVGESYTINKTVKPESLSSTIGWSSSNTGVAVVSQDGKITAKATGTAIISAKSANGKSASCKITVKKAPTLITLNATELTLEIGESFDLNSSLPSGEASYAIYYSSDNPSVASVKKAGGIVTAVAPGTATVTATTYNGNTVTCKVNVKAPKPELVLGDVNFDGKVNLKDAIEIQKCSLSLLSFDENQTTCGDVDKNGKIKLLDSIYIQKYSLDIVTDVQGIGGKIL